MDGLKEGGGGGGGNPFDVFENLFGGGRGGQAKKQGPKKGKPKLVPVKITLEDAYNGKMFKINH